MSAPETMELGQVMGQEPAGPFAADTHGIAKGDLNLLARIYRRDRAAEPRADDFRQTQARKELVQAQSARTAGQGPLSQEQWAAQKSLERAVENSSPLATRSAKDAKRHLGKIRDTAEKLEGLLGDLDPKTRKMLQERAKGLDQPHLIGALEFLLGLTAAASRDAAAASSAAQGAPDGARQKLIRAVGGRLPNPNAHQSGELYSIVATILAWGNESSADLSREIREALPK